MWGDPSIKLDLRYRCDLTAPVDASGVISRSACQYVATNCSVTRPNTQITCQAAPGSGVNHAWRVEVSGAPAVSNPRASTSDNMQTTSYQPPVITSIVAPTLQTRGGQAVRCVLVFSVVASRCQTPGLKVLCVCTLACVGSLLGYNFGLPGTPASATYNYGLYAATSCTVLSQSTITCNSNHGVGVNHTWIVTVDGQPSAPSTATTTYQLPIVYSLQLPDAAYNSKNLTSFWMLDTAGGDTIVIVRCLYVYPHSWRVVLRPGPQRAQGFVTPLRRCVLDVVMATCQRDGVLFVVCRSWFHRWVTTSGQ